MLVIDTSVVVKWYVEEVRSEDAAAYIGELITAPDLLLIELANALTKKVRANEIDFEQTVAALMQAETVVELVSTPPLLNQAVAIAVELDHPIYDCVFLALAERLNCPLVTADAKFGDKLRPTRFGTRLRLLSKAA